MIVEYLPTTLFLVVSLGILWLIHYWYSIKKELRKYAHIPGPTASGIKGFFLGEIATFIQKDRQGVSMNQYLESL